MTNGEKTRKLRLLSAIARPEVGRGVLGLVGAVGARQTRRGETAPGCGFLGSFWRKHGENKIRAGGNDQRGDGFHVAVDLADPHGNWAHE